MAAIHINYGEIVEIGNPEDLKLKYTTNHIKVILKDENKEIILKNDGEGASKIKAWMENAQLMAIHSMEPSLEKIFLNLTGREL